MSGTFKKIYTFSAPLHLPVFVKVDFMFAGLIKGSVTQIVSEYGPNEFVWHMDSAVPANAGVNLAGTATRLLFQVGDGWSETLLARVAPYDFNFPFCFNGWKLGWR